MSTPWTYSKTINLSPERYYYREIALWCLFYFMNMRHKTTLFSWTSVSTTFVLFAWLLNWKGMQVCDISMDNEVFSKVFSVISNLFVYNCYAVAIYLVDHSHLVTLCFCNAGKGIKRHPQIESSHVVVPECICSLDTSWMM